MKIRESFYGKSHLKTGLIYYTYAEFLFNGMKYYNLSEIYANKSKEIL